MPTTENLKRYVEPTDVAFEWIVEQLDGKDRRWDKQRKHHKITKIDFSPQPGGGFLTYVLRIVVHFSGTGKPFSAYLKVPTMEQFRHFIDGKRNKLGEQMTVGLVAYHNQEVRFYQLIGSRYTGFAIPKLYGADLSDPITGRHGRLLLEDIGEAGRQANAVEGLSIAQCCAVVEGIAKFHAFSRGTPDASRIMHQMSDTHLLDLADDQILLMKRLAALHEDYFVRNAKALQNLLAAAHLEPDRPHLSFGVRPVLSHGDLWASNILFFRDQHGRPGEKLYGLLDFQNSSVGVGINDLCRLILTSTTAQVQQMCTDRFLRLYYETFKQELRRYNQDVGYDFKKLKEMYDYHYPHECIFALSFLATAAFKTRDMYLREKTIQRMIAAFEPIRDKFERMRPNLTAKPNTTRASLILPERRSNPSEFSLNDAASTVSNTSVEWGEHDRKGTLRIVMG